MKRTISTKRVFQGTSAILAGVVLGWTWLAGCSQTVDTNPPVAHVQQGLSADLVISQVYGGGGNSGAPYTNDYVELFNRGSAAVSLAGLSIQYASAGGIVSYSNTLVLPSVSVAPGHYYLIQFAAGSTTSGALPTPDFIAGIAPDSGDAGFITNLSATAGRVMLVTGTTPITCGGADSGFDAAGTRCVESTAGIIDMIGYGTTAVDYEGTGPAPAGTNTTALIRKNGGCTETDQNATDFEAGTPVPRNSSSPIKTCGGDGGTDGGGADASDSADGGGTDVVTTDSADSGTADGGADTTPADAPVDGGSDTATTDDGTDTRVDDTATATDSGTPPKDSSSTSDSGGSDTNVPGDTVTTEDSGCGCEIPGSQRTPASASALALVGLAALLIRRRR